MRRRLQIESLESRRLLTAAMTVPIDLSMDPSVMQLGHNTTPYVFDDELYFSALHPELGFELWKQSSLGETPVLVKDIYPGLRSSDPMHFFEFNNELYFGALTQTGEYELWKTNGTPEGTVAVMTIRGRGVASVDPFVAPTLEYAVVGEQLLLVAGLPERGFELWKSDGTPEGSAIVSDIVPGPNGSNASELTALDGEVYFVTSVDNGLWKSMARRKEPSTMLPST